MSGQAARIARGLFALALLAALPARAEDAALAGWLDGLFAGLLESHHVPGAVVVVVRDGQVAVSRGYGVADLETRRPIDPETTLFRVASNSKLFVATAVMQQVERGALDLDSDVNRWLEGFRIPEAFGGPVTLRQLLTHTAGFDDRFLQSAETLESPPTPLRDYLARRMPPRVLPAGEVISYSNHGYALAGHLVERASGLAFAAYVEREILAPLRMTHSRFGVPDPVPPDAARPYTFQDGRFRDLGFDRIRPGPAGDLLTSGADMARFMLAHLSDGELDGARILRAETAREMRREQFRNVPDLPGWCLGFAADQHDGVTVVGHGGSWRGFGTWMMLVPGAHLGWFVSTNKDFDPAFFEALRDALFDHFLPAQRPALRPPADFAQRAGRYTGTYVPNRRVRGDFMKVGEFLQQVQVSVTDDGMLLASASAGELPPRRLVETGADLFSTPDGRHRARFETGANGEPPRLFVGATAYDRVPWYQSPRLHAAIGVAALVLFVGTVLAWLVAGAVRLVAGGPPSPVSLGARLVGGAVAALYAGGIGLFGYALATQDIWDLMIAVPAHVQILRAIPFAAAPLALSLPFFAMRGIHGRAPLARLHYAALALAALLCVAGAVYWRLWAG